MVVVDAYAMRPETAPPVVSSFAHDADETWNPRKYVGTIKQQRYANSRSASPSRQKTVEFGDSTSLTGRYSNYNGYRELSVDDRTSVLNSRNAKKILRQSSHSPDRIPKNNIVTLSKKCWEELEAKNWERKNLDSTIKSAKTEVQETKKKIEKQVKKNRMAASETIKYERERSKLVEELELMHKELLSLEKDNRTHTEDIDGLWEDNNAIMQALYEAVRTKKEAEENVSEARKLYYCESECRKMMVQSLRLHSVKNAAFHDRVIRQKDARARLGDAVKGAALYGAY